MGSPMLDVALGQVDAIVKVMQELLGEDRAKVWLAECQTKALKKSKAARAGSRDNSDDDMQFDSILPPEIPTSWIQCEDCRKWRRVPWNIDAEALPDMWYCQDNTWDEPSKTNCDAEQDVWDPTRESTLETVGAATDASEEVFEVNSSRDVYCNTNCVYYVAQVREVKHPKLLASGEIDSTSKFPCVAVKFRFKGWGAKFDEWIRVDSGRLAPLNLYTDPMSKTPAEQERWQGKDINKTSTSASTAAAAAAAATATGKRGRGSGLKGAAKPKAKRARAGTAAKRANKPDWNAVVY